MRCSLRRRSGCVGDDHHAVVDVPSSRSSSFGRRSAEQLRRCSHRASRAQAPSTRFGGAVVSTTAFVFDEAAPVGTAWRSYRGCSTSTSKAEARSCCRGAMRDRDVIATRTSARSRVSRRSPARRLPTGCADAACGVSQGVPLVEYRVQPRQGLHDGRQRPVLRRWWEVSHRRSSSMLARTDERSRSGAVVSVQQGRRRSGGGTATRSTSSTGSTTARDRDSRSDDGRWRSATRRSTYYFQPSVCVVKIGTATPSFRLLPAGLHLRRRRARRSSRTSTTICECCSRS